MPPNLGGDWSDVAMAMSLGELFVTLKVKTDKSLTNAPNKLRSTGTAAKGLGGSLKGMGAAFSAALGPITAIVAALTAVFVVIKKAITGADEQIQAVNRMNIAFANQGNLLPGTSQRMQEYANEIQRTTKLGDEQVIGASALAASFGANEEQVKQITSAAIDMSQAMGIDLKAAVQLVGKAFVGETGSLSRYGIIVDKNIPKNEKFAAVMGQLETRFGGTAAAATQTLGGSLAQLGNAVGDVVESLGILLQSLFDVGGGGVGGIQWMVEQVARFATFLRQDVVIAVSEFKALVILGFAEAAKGIGSFIQKLAGFVSIVNQDMGDAMFNTVTGLTQWAEAQRVTAETIRENANALALNGTQTEIMNQAAAQNTEQTKVQAAAQEMYNNAMKRFAIENAEARMRNAELQQQEELFAAASTEIFDTLANETMPNFGIAYTNLGGLALTETQKMANAFKNFGITTRSESAATLAQMEKDFELIKNSGEASAEAIAMAEEKLAEQRKLNSESNAMGAVDMFSTISGAASQALSGLGGKNKAWAIGMAVMNTAVAVTKALTTLPWPANLISAAGSAAAGAIQISKIKSQSTGFAKGTQALDFQNFGQETQAMLHGNEAVIPQGSGHKLASEIARAMTPSQQVLSPASAPSANRGGSGARPGASGGATIIFELNGREMARAMVPDIEDLTKRECSGFILLLQARSSKCLILK
jgi:hypothetical protein